jgi:hypothetical protein
MRLSKLSVPFRAVLASLAFVITAAPAVAQERFTVDLEAGPVWQLRNDFAVPGDEGTLVRLGDETATAARLTLVWNRWERWSLRLLAAPLSTETEFVPKENVRFEDAIFAAGTPLTVDYTFDSYRAGAFYRFAPRGPLTLRAGLTLKLRDAEIALRNGTVAASKSNQGIVPLLYGGARYQAGEKLSFDLDVDAAAAPQGRAIDAALRAEARMSDRVALYAGLRALDGGADNDEVYSFGLFGYALAGVRIYF